MIVRLGAHKVFATASVAAAALHASAVLVAGFSTPDYSQSQRAISDLGIAGQPYAFLVNYFGFALPGVFILLAALSANKLWTPILSPSLGLRCMACAGVFLIVAGFYPFPSLIHLTAALLSALSAGAGIAHFSVYAMKYRYSVILSISGWIVALLVLTDAATWVLAESRGIRIHTFMGFQQRLASFSAFVWFSAFAISSARQHNR
ncbi:MAG: DUF998 domain-containing protein [Thermodesulfovibrionales bacterium]|nr:DUF998 domain-containing protein [Thermodesulfovibrionales bacterium]